MLVIFLLGGVFASIGCRSSQIDINSASSTKLDEIIWVGSATAEKIIAARPFESVDDLIRVSGIGEIKLADIKEQNLACVEEDEEESEEETERESEKEKEEDEVEEKEIEKSVPKVGEVIQLSPKGIKSQENFLNQENLAKAGLVVFVLVLVLLFLISKLGKRKNEFRD